MLAGPTTKSTENRKTNWTGKKYGNLREHTAGELYYFTSVEYRYNKYHHCNTIIGLKFGIQSQSPSRLQANFYNGDVAAVQTEHVHN